MGGGTYGPYSGRQFSSASDTDTEQIVARSEAHDSGLCAASAAFLKSPFSGLGPGRQAATGCKVSPAYNAPERR